MLKEFIEHIQATTQPLITMVGERTFVVTADGTAEEIFPCVDRPDTLPLHSLDALVKLVRTEAPVIGMPMYITIPTHTSVLCFG